VTDDSRSRRDALADAATAWQNSSVGEDAVALSWLMLRASESGQLAIDTMREDYDDYEFTAREARNAARIAFRAVPGLRGE
jgi:hypothetical protein